ncbi:reverse transcriptase domain, Reverse transcriptase zinc-binding domain protein [Artemisia annua]|uniref:Reverse transcriptase domain, Reverse transcriptase zinc-binding domain protein n=1 Tax=Artemisia annua TaxID=35608 RepID=A0A2U1M1V3_ARTAN|nr:reverse transcriptase domain, Reverse transcriptase zinc-binding domain protein [Artemisia annua]
MTDRWSWSLTGDGVFSVKSVRNLVDDSLVSSNMRPTRWVKEVPIKINVFAWRVQLDKLASILNLSRKMVGHFLSGFPIVRRVAFMVYGSSFM